MTWLEFKNEVIEQASEVADQATAGSLDGMWAQACALFVRGEILRELHTDDGRVQTIRMYQKDYRRLRRKLLGYVPTYADSAALGVAVRLHLTADGDRKGANDFIDSMIDRANDDLTQFADWVRRTIRQGVLDLQDYIPAFRLPNETTYTSTDVVADGYTSKGRLPELGDPRQMWVTYTDPDTAECTRHELKFSPWVTRYPDMIQAQECSPLFTISPNGDRFWITPSLADANWKLIIRWDGIKLSYQDTETVPFGDESVARVTGDYLRAQIAKYDDDIQEYKVFNGDYITGRTRLFLGAKRRSNMNGGD